MGAVLVTGASGFLGGYVVRRLLEEGQAVHALARSPDKLRSTLAPLGIDLDGRGERIRVFTGDMTDEGTVRKAVDGCDHAVHAAATFSYRRGDAERMTRENTRGTVTVLDAALDAGCASVVHVSSIAALLHPGATLDPHSPPGLELGPYTTSKVQSDIEARQRQTAGAPVTIVYPGGILGPDDPKLGESNELVRDVLRGRVAVYPRGRLQLVDVRDTAEVVVASLGRPGRRFMVPGENVAVPHRHLAEVTGRRLPAVVVPLAVALPVLQLGYRTGWPWLPHALEGSRLIACGTTVDAAATVEELGVSGRPLEDTLRDTIRWLVRAGHITPAQAGCCRPE